MIKILFVCSGNSSFGITPFIKSQGDSLITQGVNVKYFRIQGEGIKGYLKNITPLRKFINQNSFDIIHAHYSLCGWVALLTFNRSPLIVSYMGCDAYGDYDENGDIIPSSYIQILLSKILQPFVKTIIVKSKNLEKCVYFRKKAKLIPNGVSFNEFKPLSKTESRIHLDLKLDEKYILFLGSPKNKRKNFLLLKKAQKIIKHDFKILNPYPISHDKIPVYLNACDTLVMTSFNEGSPNVIKEAMACNCPIVSTDVGDVKEVILNTDGCYICSYDPNDVAKKIKRALEFGRRTDGRLRIKHLDEKIIAQKIIRLYAGVMNDNK